MIVRDLVTRLGFQIDSKDLDKWREQGTKAQKAAKKLGDSLNKLKSSFKTGLVAVTAAATGVGALIKQYSKAGDEIGKTSSKYGISTRELQRMRFAAERSGASAQDLTKAIRNQAKFIEEAKDKGVTPFTDALGQVGLTVERLEGLSPEQKFGVIADALNGVSDEGTRTALSMRLVGEEAGPQLNALLREGSKGLKALGDEAESLGAVMGDDAIKATEALEDAQTNLKAVLSGLRNLVGAELVPTITEYIKTAKDWLASNREMIAVKLKEFFTQAVAAIKTIVQIFGTLISVGAKVVDFLGGMEKTIKDVGAAFLAFKGIQMALSSTMLASLGPWGLVAGAMLALIPVAMRVGDRLGDVIANVSGLLDKQRELEAAAGGRTKLRGTAAILNSGQVAGLDATRASIQNLSPEELKNLEGQVTSKLGKEVIRDERHRRLESEVEGRLRIKTQRAKVAARLRDRISKGGKLKGKKIEAQIEAAQSAALQGKSEEESLIAGEAALARSRRVGAAKAAREGGGKGGGGSKLEGFGANVEQLIKQKADEAAKRVGEQILAAGGSLVESVKAAEEARKAALKEFAESPEKLFREAKFAQSITQKAEAIVEEAATKAGEMIIRAGGTIAEAELASSRARERKRKEIENDPRLALGDPADLLSTLSGGRLTSERFGTGAKPGFGAQIVRFDVQTTNHFKAEVNIDGADHSPEQLRTVVHESIVDEIDKRNREAIRDVLPTVVR